MSEEWKITVSAHLLRRMEYKGKQSEASEQTINLPFDGATALGVLFMVFTSASNEWFLLC